MTDVLTNKYDAAIYTRERETALAQDERTRGILQAVKWGGWLLMGSISLGWIAWISLLVQDNRVEVIRVTERQTLQYEQLREAVSEIKTLLSRSPPAEPRRE